MLRILWGVVLVVMGALIALQTFGILAANLTFWPVVLTIVGISLAVRGLFPGPYRLRSGPAWMKLTIGLWLTGIGVLDILHANQITALSGSDVWSVGWFIVLVGAGLVLSIRGGWQLHIRTDPDSYRQGGGVGDLHYAREHSVMDRNFSIQRRLGDL